ncbi:protein FAR1-RELATED SEQUENCE 8-like [Silene latifolia]|uniref:protein FAR1-RELATED SEQUENCE 8-like n=1 Tax=Silene latifolia TaxID=37657 RepID=UPI003D7801B3
MYKRVRLCCTRAAKPRKKNIDVSSFKPCECVVEATLLDDFMVVKHARLDHNHDDLNPANSRHMVGYRVWDEYFKRRALMNDETSIPIAKNFNTLVREVGGHANLTVIERDLRNMLNQERRRFRIQGDANALEERFIKLKEIDPDFYYAIQTNSKGMLVNVFWADGRYRAMAKVFGDAISYDATFLCNRYKMPFTPFVGLNHHGSTVVLASTLISHEDAASFTWVFRRWLDCMGRPPSVIITDQCRGIGLAVKTIFLNTPHRLCLWHIMRNGFKNLGNFARFREIKHDLRDVVYESKDIDDFEASWQIFVDKYGIRRHSWIKEMYEKKGVMGSVVLEAHVLRSEMNIGQFSSFVVTEEAYYPCYVAKKVQLIPNKYILTRFRKDLVRGYEHLQVGYHTPGESERLKRSLGVTLRNDYIFRLSLQSDYASAIYDRDTSKMVKKMEATVGIQTLNDMGAGCEVNRLWGEKETTTERRQSTLHGQKCDST